MGRLFQGRWKRSTNPNLAYYSSDNNSGTNVQVHQFDLFASSAITASGTSEGHGAFRATVEIVSGMIQIFLCKQGSIFRVIEVEPDGTIIMTQSGAESLM